MTFQIRDLSATHKECTIDYPKSDIEVKFKSKLSAAKNQLTLPGFRKGKAPIQRIEQSHGQYLIQEMIEEHIQKCWDQIRTTCEVLERPLVSISPQPNAFKSLKDLPDVIKITLSFDVAPHIELIDPEVLQNTLNISFKEPDPITPEAIASCRKVLELQCSESSPVDRACAENDKVILDIVYLENAKTEKDLEIVLDKNETQEEFIQAIVGMNVGEERTFSYVPASYESKNDNKPVEITVTLKSVFELTPPTLERLTAYVRDLNQAGETDEGKLQEWLEKTLSELHLQKAFRENEAALLEALDRHHQFEIPSVHLRGKKFQTDAEEQKAIHQVKMNYIFGKYSEVYSLRPSPEDIDFFAKIFAQDIGLPLQYISQMIQNNPTVRDRFNEILVERTVIKYMIEGKSSHVSSSADHHVHTADCHHDHDHVHTADCHHD
jgi:trigger factor